VHRITLRFVPLLLLSCTHGADSAADPAAGQAIVSDRAAGPPRSSTPPLSECERLERRYLQLRSAQNRCERDSECAEIHPGLCPHGPYYVHVDAEHGGIAAAAEAAVNACASNRCEKTMPLGIAHCEAGRCVRGREAPESGPDESCWDTRVTYMDPGWPYLGQAHEHLTGTTPLYAVSVAAPGVLRISATLGCEGCELQVSEHNTGMSNLIGGTTFVPEPDDPKAIRPVTSRAPPAFGTEVHLEFEVRPGPYFIAALGAPGQVQYELSLRNASGEAMAPDRRGVVHLRICEG